MAARHLGALIEGYSGEDGVFRVWTAGLVVVAVGRIFGGLVSGRVVGRVVAGVEQLKFYAKREENILITWNVKAVNEDDKAVDATYGPMHEQLSADARRIWCYMAVGTSVEKLCKRL
ncbi:hypothetical protein Tco_1411846 [Tanacetum coccineum]